MSLKSLLESLGVYPGRGQLLRGLYRPKIELIRSSFPWLVSRSTNTFPILSEENPDRYQPGGYHPVRLGDIFSNKYQVISKLGYGTYSTVWLARDIPSSQYVALKILTADSYGNSKPTYELDILRHIKQTDRSHPGHKHVVHLLDSFIHEGQHGGHLCLVLNLMGQSIRDLQESFPGKQLPIQIGRQIARQVLQALDWLHRSCGIIHTDIKPDNILIEIPNVDQAVRTHLVKLEESKTEQRQGHVIASQPIVDDTIFASSNFNIRITDFGVASWEDNHLTEWIQPPSLRAPEVFLGAPWSHGVDVWGFGCVIYELLQGRVLFRGRPGPKGAWTAEEDQIAQTIELFGPIPKSVREAGKFSSGYFDGNGDLLHIKQMYPYSLKGLLAQTTNTSMSASDYDEFEVFLRDMLQYEPLQRKRPHELLKSPWL